MFLPLDFIKVLLQDDMSKISCDHFPQCSGCQFIGQEESYQKESKLALLSSLMSPLKHPIKSLGWISAGPAYLRDRLDFIWENGTFGLYSHTEKKIIAIDFCHQLSPALNTWFQEFKKIQWPVKKGSIRLRIGPTGLKGVWLDFANLDIKALLEENLILTQLLEAQSIVEMGQKRKILKREGSLLKLKDPEANLWFESRFHEKTYRLFCHIASFTQPSMKANQLILQQIEKWVIASGVKKAAEFGAGVGNISLAVLNYIDQLRIFENDSLSLECFHQTLDQSQELKNQKQKISFHIDDHQQKNNLAFESDEILILNPPRSGLKRFLESIESSVHKPENLIYMSCSPESWIKDGIALESMGYRLNEALIADQFPQTKHFEILSRWLFQGN